MKTTNGTEVRDVVPGLSDDKWVEIKSGLSEGEVLIMNSTDGGGKANLGVAQQDNKGASKGSGKEGKGTSAPPTTKATWPKS